MTIKELGNKQYQIRVTKIIQGKRKEKKFSGVLPTKGAAKAKEKELTEKLEQLKKAEDNEALSYTWKKALNDYFDHSKEIHRLSTYYNRRKVLEAHTASLYEVELNKLDKIVFKELFDSFSFSISHKHEVLKYIRQVFELAIDERKANYNPVRNLKFHIDKNSLTKANKLMAMSQIEINKLLDYTKVESPEWFSIFYVTYHLGLRSGEAIALEFSDIDWDRGHVHIIKSWSEELKGFTPPKNGESRIVPMSPSLKLYLQELSLAKHSKGYVLPRNKSWMHGRTTKSLQEFQKILGIKLTNYHSLRSSFITHLLRLGKDIITVQAMVGHKDLKTTQRYIRLDATDLSGATDLLDFKSEATGKILSFN